MKLQIVLSIIFLIGATPVFAAPPKYDLAVSDVTFSEQTLVAGATVRMYARVQNLGTTDMKGYVSFYQGPSLIGESQVISVRANGFADDVFMDFTVPDQSFNIRAVLQGIDRDENGSNNEIVTSLITPTPDTDHDSIPDTTDNCSTIFNTDQIDHDGDKLGDVCDDDDDNDGIPDAREISMGTNPFAADTDGDGVNDATDAFPTDGSRTTLPPPPPPAVPQKKSAPTPPPVAEVVTPPPSKINPPSSTPPSVTSTSTTPSTKPPSAIPPAVMHENTTTPPLIPKKRESTFSERVAYSDATGFFEATNPRVWGAISTLGLLALASFVFERVQGARRTGLPDEPASPLLPLEPMTNLEPVTAGLPDKPKRKRKVVMAKKKISKSRSKKII